MIRSHVGQQFNSEQFNTVPKEGLEPSHPKAQEPKSCVSTSSTTPALFIVSLAKLARRGSRLDTRLLRRRSGTEKRVPSLLLSTARGAIRVYCLARQARSTRIAPGHAPTSSSLGDGKIVRLAALLTELSEPQHHIW